MTVYLSLQIRALMQKAAGARDRNGPPSCASFTLETNIRLSACLRDNFASSKRIAQIYFVDILCIRSIH